MLFRVFLQSTFLFLMFTTVNTGKMWYLFSLYRKPVRCALAIVSLLKAISRIIYNLLNIFAGAWLVLTHHLTEYSPAKTGEYPRLVYTKTVDSVEGARWLASQTPNIHCYLPLSNSRKNGVPVCIHDKRRNHPNSFFCGLYYLTVSVYTKTAIHLSVGG